MKRTIKLAAILFVAVFIIMQLFRPSFSNPEHVPGETLEDSTTVPADVGVILSRSCNDCHSNKTSYPWYSKISPFSWFLSTHIDEGRSELNFSVWNTYTVQKKIHKLEEICEMVETKAMPLPSYLWIHRDAELSVEQSKTLYGWATAEKQRLSDISNSSTSDK